MKRQSFAARWLSCIRGQRGDSRQDLGRLDTDVLLGLMRHETHRIEKAVYNRILDQKRDAYIEKRNRVGEILAVLDERGVGCDEPTVDWCTKVHAAFDDLESGYVKKWATGTPTLDPCGGRALLDLMRARRSVRVWSDEQPSDDDFEFILEDMLEAARWAPNSGNRQALRFMILRSPAEKGLLRGLKESHCVEAPILIFVGADTRLYGALGADERCTYLDAGAAIMQMLLVASSCGLGTCWNHMAEDLISSRSTNVAIYQRFASELGVPEYVTPIAVVAVGRAAFTPPIPARMTVADYVLRGRSIPVDGIPGC